MPSEIVPSIGGGRNWSFTPVVLRSEGVAAGEGVGVAEGAGVDDGVAVGEGATVGEASGVALGSGVGACAAADAARPKMKRRRGSPGNFTIKNGVQA
jgi:hypothetical protein